MNNSYLLKCAIDMDEVKAWFTSKPSMHVKHVRVPTEHDMKHNVVSDFLRGDRDGGMDWRWGMLGGMGLDKAMDGLSSGYMRLAHKPHELRSNEVSADKWLRNHASSNGIGIVDTPRTEPMPTGNLIRDWIEQKRRLIEQSPHFDTRHNLVNLPEGSASPGILAHELGHAAQSAGMRRMGLLGKPVAYMGTGGALFSGNKLDSFNNALMGTGGGIATLINELHASSKGSKLLGEAGVKGIGRLKSFVGVPTYGMLAAMPMAAYGLKNVMGGFDAPR